MQDIDLLYHLRFIIRDIGQQLTDSKCSSSIRVYRLQQMSNDEIEILKNSIGELISINSFFSTSLNQQQAKLFHSISTLTNDMEQVFFEIHADLQTEKMQTFSRISSLSYYPSEEEVLFMIGSIFRLDSIERSSQGIWNISLVLCSNNDQRIQTLLQYMKDELGTGETNLFIFGHILRKMGKLDSAEKYYCRFLNQLPVDDSNRAHCYHALGLLTDERGDYDGSLIWYKKSLEIFVQTLQSNDPNLATSYNSIAIVYQRKSDYILALQSYEKALSIWKQIFGDEHPNVAVCLNNMSNAYRNQKNYSKALECIEKSLTILQKHLPADHADLAASYGSIGNIHLCMKHHDQALESYNHVLKIYEKSLPFEHPDIAMTMNNIGLVYEDKYKYQQALKYFEQARKIYSHSLPSTHPNIIQIEQNIKRISSKLK